MSIQVIVISVLVVGGAGLVIGLLLGVAGKKFAMQTDEREQRIREALPGNNCGGCGYPGCDGAAAAIVAGEAPVTVCPVGGAAAAKAIGAIMGQEVGETRRMTAFVACAGTCDKVKTDYIYTGVEDCRVMKYVPGGGPKRCDYGCLGYGSCVKACAFDAIHLSEGVAVVDRDACKGCGACVAACPNHLISLVPWEGVRYHVACSSRERGKAVTDSCGVGCIGCKKCERVCPVQAVSVQNHVAVIDAALCIGCGKCAESCPRGCIVKNQE